MLLLPKGVRRGAAISRLASNPGRAKAPGFSEIPGHKARFHVTYFNDARGSVKTEYKTLFKLLLDVSDSVVHIKPERGCC